MSLRPSTRNEARKKAYKTGVDAEEARRRREDNLVEIRKSKREDNLLKKRREGLQVQAQQQPPQQFGDGSQNIEKRVLFSYPISIAPSVASKVRVLIRWPGRLDAVVLDLSRKTHRIVDLN